MNREDHTNYLIHWTCGNDDEEAFVKLINIIENHEINGNNNCVKGNYNCICFSETPAKFFACDNNKYKPFGIGLSKKFIFNLGGRHVIYQSDSEYQDLPEKLRWRHVRYEPTLDPAIDFTWEREWRIKVDFLHLPEEEALIVVKNEEWAKQLVEEFNQREWDRYYCECMGYGETCAYPPRELYYRILLKDQL